MVAYLSLRTARCGLQEPDQVSHSSALPVRPSGMIFFSATRIIVSRRKYVRNDGGHIMALPGRAQSPLMSHVSVEHLSVHSASSIMLPNSYFIDSQRDSINPNTLPSEFPRGTLCNCNHPALEAL
jgi:hypothetical protein